MLERRLSIWVGIIVVLSIVVLVLAYGILSRFLDRGQMYVLHVKFHNAQGIQPGAEVRLSGVTVGRVSSVGLTSDKQARVTIEIREGTDIGDNFVFSISSGLVLGEKAVEIEPSSPPYDILSQGDVVQGREVPGISDVLADVPEVISEIKGAAEAIRGLISDTEMRANVEGILGNLNAASSHFAGLVAELKDVTVRNRGQIDETVAEMRGAAANLSGILEEIRLTFKESISEEAIQEIQDALAKAAKNVEEITESIRDLAIDESVKSDIRETMHNVRATSEQANEIAGRVNRITAKAENAAESWSDFTSNLALGYAMLSSMDEHRIRADFDVGFSTGGKSFYRLGVYDAGESNRTIAQFGEFMTPDLAFRAGVYASKLGVGLDYHFQDSGTIISLDWYRPNDPHTDLIFRHRVSDGMQILLGVEDLFKRNSPVLGFQYGK